MAKRAPQPSRNGAQSPAARGGFRPITEPEEVTPDPNGNRAQRRAAAKAAKQGRLPEPAEGAESESENDDQGENDTAEAGESADAPAR
ncbi:hypothetical protein [Streptomyces profundus]|uniref:hypothetical protein n=1 Tax=Streptomyces profundus TaxID=2867410 RepID=UPI001D16B7D8|nr:hypothetical protein [Streptomyces sp. MA3_2.13]UED85559.1 hypothetical protein K4G22_16295 [Streptomyces sp. MA3_2.13]